jgi:hypothetical protein
MALSMKKTFLPIGATKLLLLQSMSRPMNARKTLKTRNLMKSKRIRHPRYFPLHFKKRELCLKP